MKILHLNLKKKWFDMILSGKKKEEYRTVSDYWMKRIVNVKGCGTSYNFTILQMKGFNFNKNVIDFIIFRNGYSKNSPEIKIECKGVVVDMGKKHLGAPNYKCFVLKLGKIIETKNIRSFNETDT
jgi:hypothetical protein